jgi:hypothetical protein
MPNVPDPVDDTASTAAPEVEAPPATSSISVVTADEPNSEPDAAAASLDNALLNSAHGDTDVWGQEMARFLLALTGKHIEPTGLSTIFAAFGQQVQSETYKMAAVAVANSRVEPKGQTAQALLAVLDFRTDVAALLLQTVNE